MKRSFVKRRYDGAGRRAAAGRTRAAILKAAGRLFIEHGYAATAVADIARAADVAVDTVYASVGTKQAVLRTLIETAISGTDRALPAEERQYVQSIRREPDARRKLRVYAAAVREIHERLAPLIRVLKDAAPADRKLAALWRGISKRRAKNMRHFAAELHATGQLRAGLEIDEVADVIWATNAPEFYLLLVGERGWPPERFEEWLAGAWTRLLVRGGDEERV